MIFVSDRAYKMEYQPKWFHLQNFLIVAVIEIEKFSFKIILVPKSL